MGNEAKSPDWTYSDLHYRIATATTREQKNAMYDKYALIYEDACIDMDYQSPKNTVDTVWAKIKDYQVHDQQKIRILDVGCGTGLVGVRLCEIDGFDKVPIHLVGLDMNESMLAHAKKTGEYHELVCADFNTVSFPEGPFDFVVASGLFWHGDCGPEDLPALLKFLKEGGYASISVRTKWFKEKDFAVWIDNCGCDVVDDAILPYVGSQIDANYLLLRKRFSA